MNGKTQLVIWGASGHAAVVADIVRLQARFEIAGFLEDIDLSRHHTMFCGAPILGGGEQLDHLRAQGIGFVLVCIGDCAARLRLAEVALAKGFELATAMHPAAVVAEGAQVGPGTVLAAGSVVNPGATLGRNVIVNTCASVDHDCVLEDGVHISPGAHLGGGVTVGRGTWIGIGAVVRDHVMIGAGVTIGAGAVVVKDIPDGVMAYGVPARVVKEI
jgi:UDP-N-acetylbacillosamine N-acetyltransferase